VAHITANELQRYLDRTEVANGLINRFLVVCSRRVRFLPEGGSVDQQALVNLAERMGEAVMVAQGIGEMHRDDEARELWAASYRQLSHGRPGLLGAATSRAEAQVLRLSMVYALLDSSSVIRRPHLEAALSIWDYVEESTRYVLGDTLGDPVADALLTALERAGSEGLTRTQIRDLFSRHASAEKIDRALADLEALGRAERSLLAETGGRPASVWRAIARDAGNANTEAPKDAG
jgi:hypothetical protein